MSGPRWAGAALLMAGCASPTSFMGLDLRAAGEVGLLARAAQAGDKAAQLALGERFEEGRGVPEDLERACRLYEAAAATTGGTMFVYSPPVRPGGSGQVIPINTPVRPGLPAARERLSVLAYRGSSTAGAGSTCLERHR